MKQTKLCALCGACVPKIRHSLDGKFCSKRCEMDHEKLDEIRTLEFLKEGINALGYRDFAGPSQGYATTVILGDTHFPFVSNDILARAIRFIERIQPTFVIQVGDLYDYFSMGKYPKSLSLMTPQEEVLRGRIGAEEMWKAIHIACPSAKKIQLRGNHDARPYKRMLEKSPELEPFFQINHLFEFPQVETVQDDKQEVVLDGVLFQHGYRKHGDHMKVSLMPTVHGHTHKAGIIYQKLRNELIWEMDVGMLADAASIPLGYGPTRWSACIQGIGFLDSMGPRFIHYTELP